MLSALLKCDRLSRLTGAQGDLTILALQARLGERLTEIRIGHRALCHSDFAAFAAACTAVRTLVLYVRPEVPDSVLAWKLPHLTTLRVHTGSTQPLAAIRSLVTFLRAWPSLRHLASDALAQG